MERSTSIMCARCGEHPARSADEPFCPICVISIKVEVARGLTQLTGYLRAWAAFDDWCLAHGRAGIAA
jgi:hypothetical protein